MPDTVTSQQQTAVDPTVTAITQTLKDLAKSGSSLDVKTQLDLVERLKQFSAEQLHALDSALGSDKVNILNSVFGSPGKASSMSSPASDPANQSPDPKDAPPQLTQDGLAKLSLSLSMRAASADFVSFLKDKSAEELLDPKNADAFAKNLNAISALMRAPDGSELSNDIKTTLRNIFLTAVNDAGIEHGEIWDKLTTASSILYGKTSPLTDAEKTIQAKSEPVRDFLFPPDAP